MFILEVTPEKSPRSPCQALAATIATVGPGLGYGVTFFGYALTVPERSVQDFLLVQYRYWSRPQMRSPGV